MENSQRFTDDQIDWIRNQIDDWFREQKNELIQSGEQDSVPYMYDQKRKLKQILCSEKSEEKPDGE